MSGCSFRKRFYSESARRSFNDNRWSDADGAKREGGLTAHETGQEDEGPDMRQERGDGKANRVLKWWPEMKGDESRGTPAGNPTPLSPEGDSADAGSVAAQPRYSLGYVGFSVI